jgi:hypothetical protein
MWTLAVCDTTVFFTTLVRDQEVEGSNPFALTISQWVRPGDMGG